LYACLCTGAALAAQQAPIPAATELGGHPFAIRQKWVIGGAGNWDYLTIDPTAGQLLVAHQTQVQVVDIASGSLIGAVDGFGEAHQVVLDPDGQHAYASDGRENVIRIFDRRSLRVTAKIPVGSSPRALAFEPQSGLIVAFGSLPSATPRTRAGDRVPCSGGRFDQPSYQSLISFVDPVERTKVADIQICGILGAAEPDGEGHVYFAITNLSGIGRVYVPEIASRAVRARAGKLDRLLGSLAADGTLLIDMRMYTEYGVGGNRRFSLNALDMYPAGHACAATSLAIDAAHNQLFVGCSNQIFEVLNTETGQEVASMTIGPGVDSIAYDPNRNLIFTANGGGYGSVSVIRQHLTDSYAVIQNLPTMERARTMAVDPSSGLVYLVTDLHGAGLDHPPARGIGSLRLDPVEGSFQVLVIGD
jgi:YVTN family beta-propeller protein